MAGKKKKPYNYDSYDRNIPKKRVRRRMKLKL